jgi:hypothetical protein
MVVKFRNTICPLHRSSPFIEELCSQAIQMEHGPYIAERTQNTVYIVRCLWAALVRDLLYLSCSICIWSWQTKPGSGSSSVGVWEFTSSIHDTKTTATAGHNQATSHAARFSQLRVEFDLERWVVCKFAIVHPIKSLAKQLKWKISSSGGWTGKLNPVLIKMHCPKSNAWFHC